MDWSLKVAAGVFLIALILAVVIGIWVTWSSEAGMSPFLGKVLASSLFAFLGAGSYIALRDALHRLRAPEQRGS